jgi:hypothetical protein
VTHPNIEAAVRWSLDEFDRRTRLLEEDSPEARVDWINPDYRVSWTDVCARFFDDPPVRHFAGLRIDYDTALKQELTKRRNSK